MDECEWLQLEFQGKPRISLLRTRSQEEPFPIELEEHSDTHVMLHNNKSEDGRKHVNHTKTRLNDIA